MGSGCAEFGGKGIRILTIDDWPRQKSAGAGGADASAASAIVTPGGSVASTVPTDEAKAGVDETAATGDEASRSIAGFAARGGDPHAAIASPAAMLAIRTQMGPG